MKHLSERKMNQFEYIERTTYNEKVMPFIGTNLIKVLTGQRRVGKSYLLHQMKDNVLRHTPDRELIWVDKERKEFDEIRTDADLVQYVEDKCTPGRQTCLFIDEVQDIRDFEKALRHFHATGRTEVWCTGSNAGLFSGEISSLLSGRQIIIHVSSLSFQEFIHFQNLEPNSTSLGKYIRFGGMPYLKNLRLDEAIVREYLVNIYNTILYKDIVNRYHIRSTYILESLVSFVMDNIGNLFSALKISEYLKSQQIKVSVRLILEYLSFLENAFFLYRIRRSDIKGKKIFEVGEKYYVEDLGIRNTIRTYSVQDMGKIMENLVYHHLKRNDYQIYVGKIDDKEIDFVAYRGNDVLYVQVVYLIPDKTTHDREFGNLLLIPDNYRKIVVSNDELPAGLYKGIEHMKLIDFLMTTL